MIDLASGGLNARLRCDFSFGDALGQIVIWLLLLIVTFGLAAFVRPYYVIKAVMNKTWLKGADGQPTAHLTVDIDFASILGHALVWLILTLLTLGIAYLFFWQSVLKRLINASTFQPV